VLPRLFLLALIGVALVSTDASASKYSHRTHSLRHYASGGGEVVAHPAKCPHSSFCGCGAARELGLSDRSLWLVRSWYRFPRAAAAPGMAALWGTRHVAIIREVHGDGTATVYDANSGGGLTRVHRVSLAGRRKSPERIDACVTRASAGSSAKCRAGLSTGALRLSVSRQVAGSTCRDVRELCALAHRLRDIPHCAAVAVLAHVDCGRLRQGALPGPGRRQSPISAAINEWADILREPRLAPR